MTGDPQTGAIPGCHALFVSFLSAHLMEGRRIILFAHTHTMFEGSCVRDTFPSMQRIANHFKATQDIGEVCIENLIEIEHDSWCGGPEKATATIYGHNGEEWVLAASFKVHGVW